MHPRARVSVYVCAHAYLLLVFPLQVQSGLDIASRLLEGLSLGDLSRVVGTDPDHVSAQEDQHVGADLKTHTHMTERVRRKKKNLTKHAHVTSQEYRELCLTWERSIHEIDNILCHRIYCKEKNSSNV